MRKDQIKKYSEIATAWPFQEARKIAELHTKINEGSSYSLPKKQSFVGFESGFGPSGRPHIGTFFESIRTSMVQKAFRHLTGLPTKFFIVSDDFDALRKVPDNLPNKEELVSWIGMPLSKVPDPFGKSMSYADAMTGMLIDMLEEYDLEYELIKSSEAYVSGEYNETIKRVLQNYEQIDNIVRHSIGPVRQETYGLLMPVSPFSGKIIEHVKIKDINPLEGTYTYVIPSDAIIQKKGVGYGISPSEYYPDDPLDQEVTMSALNGHSKLQWKVDWPMRMVSRNIAYEMHGEDLEPAANIAYKICRVLETAPPVLYKHGLILDGHGKKISKSNGNGFSLERAQKYLNSDVIAYLAFQRPSLQRKFYPGMIPTLYTKYIQDRDSYGEKSQLEKMNNPLFHTMDSEYEELNSGISEHPTFHKLVNVIASFSPEDNSKLQPIIEQSLLEYDQQKNVVDAAFSYYEDFIKNSKAYYAPSQQEKTILKQLSKRIEELPDGADSGCVMKIV